MLIEQLSSDDQIRLMERVSLVLPDEEVKGELLVSRRYLHFVEELDDEDEEESSVKRVQSCMTADRKVWGKDIARD